MLVNSGIAGQRAEVTASQDNGGNNDHVDHKSFAPSEPREPILFKVASEHVVRRLPQLHGVKKPPPGLAGISTLRKVIETIWIILHSFWV